MDDFAVVIRHMPYDHMYNRDLNILTAQLNQHITSVVHKQYLKENPSGNNFKELEIADINFG